MLLKPAGAVSQSAQWLASVMYFGSLVSLAIITSEAMALSSQSYVQAYSGIVLPWPERFISSYATLALSR